MAHRSQDTDLQGAVAWRIACKIQTCKEQSHGASLARYILAKSSRMAHRLQDTDLQGAVSWRIARKNVRLFPTGSCKELSHSASLARLSYNSIPVLQGAVAWRIARKNVRLFPTGSCKEQSHSASLAGLSDYSITVLQGEVAWRLARKTVQLYPTSHAGSSHMAHPSHDCPIIPHQSCKEQSQDAWASALSPRFLLGCKL